MAQPMLDSFRQFVQSIYSVPEAELEKLFGQFVEKQIAKKDFLFREGERTEELYFLYSGLYRSYCYKDGAEVTLDFYFPPAFYANVVAIREKTPSILNVQAMEGGEVLVTNLREVEKMALEHPVLLKLFIRFFERIYTGNQKRQLSFIFETAEERYRRLFEQRPQVINDIPLLHIATYLGIKPESLSRIRRKMTGKHS